MLHPTHIVTHHAIDLPPFMDRLRSLIVGDEEVAVCIGIGGEAEERAVCHTRFILTEGRERVGGNITSLSSSDGYRWEEGPNSFQPNDSMLKAAVRKKSSAHTLHIKQAVLPPRYELKGWYQLIF